ncbi:hypothetical protein DXG01_005270 [Tephrocybe rancida]|nr:hypothetical protein DXG01_005270 [Tephrocybe rancida]
MPANTSIFHGRDSIVTELVSIITGPARHHICILGPGGMGKTSAALAVMEHADVLTRFSNQIVWVPCVKATSFSLFLTTLHTSLGITTNSGNLLKDILSDLKGESPLPIVLLLNNFETIWNVDEVEAEQVLRKLHQFPHVTLFITMRSSTPPCDDLPWHHIDLRALDAISSRKIYNHYHRAGREDPDVPRLLALIGYLSLAIKLLAHAARTTCQGFSAETRLDICLGLSVYSSCMKAHPEAFTLLCMLSMLPAGASYKTLSKWWARNLPNLVGALAVLKITSLVEGTNTSYFVLPVIQRYVRDASRFLDSVRTSMIDSACFFLKEHASSISDPRYKSDIEALSSENDNLEAVLLTVTPSTNPHIIRGGLLSLARYQHQHRPRLDVIEHALNLASGINDNILLGDIHVCQGDILDSLFQYKRALHSFNQALHLFLAMSDRKRFIECRLRLTQKLRFHSGTFDAQRANIVAAFQDCEAIDVCICPIEKHRPLSECCQVLSWATSATGDYELANEWAESALEETVYIGYAQGRARMTHEIGYIRFLRGDYDGCIKLMRECLQIRKSAELRPLGRALQVTGLASLKLGRTEDAGRAFDEALRVLLYAEAHPFWIVSCQFFLRHLDNSELEPTPKEMDALCSIYHSRHVNDVILKR